MSIASESQRQEAIREFLESRQYMQQGIASVYERMGDLLARLTALQADVATWAQAEPGTVEAELFALHRAVIPAESDTYINQIAGAAAALRAAVESADAHSGGAWFGVTGGE